MFLILQVEVCRCVVCKKRLVRQQCDQLRLILSLEIHVLGDNSNQASSSHMFLNPKQVNAWADRKRSCKKFKYTPVASLKRSQICFGFADTDTGATTLCTSRYSLLQLSKHLNSSWKAGTCLRNSSPTEKGLCFRRTTVFPPVRVGMQFRGGFWDWISHYDGGINCKTFFTIQRIPISVHRFSWRTQCKGKPSSCNPFLQNLANLQNSPLPKPTLLDWWY